MAQVIVAHVPLDPGVVRAVHRHAAVEALPHAASGEVLPVHRSHHVPVHRIPGHEPLLSHEVQLHAFDPEGPAHPHDVAAESGRAGGAVALDHDVAGKQADLGTLVDGPAADRLQLAVVREDERLRQLHQGPTPRGDGHDFSARGIEVGRGHDQLVPRPPVRRAVELKLRRAGHGGRGEARPPIARLAVQIERAAVDPEHAVSHAHHGRRVRAARERDRRPVLERLRRRADAEGAQHGDPARCEVEVRLVEHEGPFDGKARERRRAHVEQDRAVLGNGDRGAGYRYLSIGPSGRIRPAHGRRQWRLGSGIGGTGGVVGGAGEECRTEHSEAKAKRQSALHGGLARNGLDGLGGGGGDRARGTGKSRARRDCKASQRQV